MIIQFKIVQFTRFILSYSKEGLHLWGPRQGRKQRLAPRFQGYSNADKNCLRLKQWRFLILVRALHCEERHYSPTKFTILQTNCRISNRYVKIIQKQKKMFWALIMLFDLFFRPLQLRKRLVLVVLEPSIGWDQKKMENCTL